jgi:hypothetical protein
VIGPTPDLVEQPGDGLLDEVGDLALEVVGLGLKHEDPPGGVAHRDDRGAVLGRVRWQGPQSRAAVDEFVGGRVAQLVAQLLAGGDDQGLEVVDRLRAGADRAAAGDQQHPDRLAVAAGSRLGEMVAL